MPATFVRQDPCPCCEAAPDAYSGWHQQTGPLPMLRARFGESDRRWLDHLWRFRNDDGSWTWIAEPYRLDTDDMSDLAWLERQGYDVAVTASGARHAPGHTVAVAIISPERTTP